MLKMNACALEARLNLGGPFALFRRVRAMICLRIVTVLLGLVCSSDALGEGGHLSL